MSLRELLGLQDGGQVSNPPSSSAQRDTPVMASSSPHHQHHQMTAAGQKRPRSRTPPTNDSLLNAVNSWRDQERLHLKQMDSGGRIGAIELPREAASVPKFAQQQVVNGSTSHGTAEGVWRGGSGGWVAGGMQDQRSRDFLCQQQPQQKQPQQQQQQHGEQQQHQQQEALEARHHWEQQRQYRQLQLKQEEQRQELLNEAARHSKARQKQMQRQKQIHQQQQQQKQQQQHHKPQKQQLLPQQRRFDDGTAPAAARGGRFLHNSSPSPPPPQQQQHQPDKKSSKKREQHHGSAEASDAKRVGEGGGGKQELVALQKGHGVEVDHLNMLVSLVEEMTCKWERQLEDTGEGKWTDDMLAKEGTDAMKAVRSAALAGPVLPVGVIDWPGVASSLWRRHQVAWSPQLCQGLWKFVAYGDVTAAMNALPRAGETLSGAWTRQDLLYESDTESLSTNPLCISKKDSNSKNPRWGRSRSDAAKKHERSQAEKARSEEPLRRAPMLMSGSVDLRHSPERPRKAGTQQAKGRASSDEDPLIPLCTLASLATSIRRRKRLVSSSARSRDPPSPRSAKAAAEVAEAEARVYEERQAMQLLLEQSAADSSAAKQQNSKVAKASSNSQPQKGSPLVPGVGGGGMEGSRAPEKKKRRKSNSVDRVSPEAAKQAEIWAAAGDAAATAAAAAASAAAAAAAGAGAGSSKATSMWSTHRPMDAGPQRGVPADAQVGWRNQAEPLPPMAGSRRTTSAEDLRQSPNSAVFSHHQGSVINTVATAREQEALRERLSRGEQRPVHSPGLGNQRVNKQADEQQQASRQQEYQGLHHLRLAVSEASPPPVPPTANLHALHAKANHASGQGNGDDTIGRSLAPHHAAVQHRHSAVGSPFSSQHQQQQQQQQQQQRSYQQTITSSGGSHTNRPAKVTYIHMPSNATHGTPAQAASAGDAVAVGSAPVRNLHPVVDVELTRGGAGEVRSSSSSSSSSISNAGGRVEVGLSGTPRGQPSWNRSDGYGGSGGLHPGNASPRPAGFATRSPVSAAGGMVPGFGAIAGGVGAHLPLSSEPKE